MNKLILHIGPPKTATTSLQFFFQNLSIPNLEYLGVNQPRSSFNQCFTKKIHNYIAGKSNELNINELKEKIERFDIIMSEEMFLVTRNEITWYQKLEKLYSILNEFDTTILIVARNPIDAIKSYYQELYYSLREEDFSSINEFALSSYCEIYNYNKLIETLNKVGFKKIKVLDYEKLVKGAYNLNSININSGEKINLNHKNKSIKTNKGYYAKNGNLKKIIIKKIPKSAKNIIPNTLKKNIAVFIPNIQLKKGLKIKTQISQEICDEYTNSFNLLKKTSFYIK